MFRDIKRNSIRTRLLQGFINVIIFTAVIMSIAFIYIIQKTQIDDSNYLLNAASKVAWDIFYKRPHMLKGILEESRKLPELQSGLQKQDINMLNDFLIEMDKTYTDVSAWVITDENGFVLIKSNNMDIENGKRFLPEIVNDSIRGQKTIISTENIPDRTIITINDTSFGYELATVVVCPVIKPDGKVIGTVSGYFLLNEDIWISNEYTNRIPNTYLSIALKDGQRISSNIKTKGFALPIGSYQEEKLVNTILEKKQFNDQIINVAGEKSIIKVDPIINYTGEVVGNIGVGTIVKSFNFFEKPNFSTIIIVFITVIVFAVILANAISRIITKPISKLEDLALMINDDMVKVENIKWSGNNDTSEVYSLANTMIKMAQTLKLKENESQSYARELSEERAKLEEKVKIRTMELVDSVERLELTNQYKSQFLANMSHELKTPLNSIIGFSSLLKDQVGGELNTKQMLYAGTINNSAEELLQLINDILDLEKIEQGKYSFNPEKVNIEDMIDSSLLLINGSIKNKELILNVNSDKGLPMPVWDYSKVKQIITNLISNAVKFTPSGGSIDIIAELKGEDILFAVKDTGIGIKEEDRERVFLAFEQADSSYSRSFKGTGLGLAICKKNVEMHGGEIWIESNYPNGTIIYVTLPIKLSNTISELGEIYES